MSEDREFAAGRVEPESAAGELAIQSPPGRLDWDAATYDRISEPQLQWAREQISRLELSGDEVVLDAGCGSGRVTALLADLVPRGRVYGVDVAPSMAAHAAHTLALSHPDRATILCQDLVALELPEPRLGFTDVSCWLESKPTTPPEPRTFAKSVCLVRHLDALPAELHDAFLDRVMERVIARGGEPVVLDYVRLNLTARRGG